MRPYDVMMVGLGGIGSSDAFHLSAHPRLAAVVAREHPPVEPPGPAFPCTRSSIVRTGGRLLVGASSHVFSRAAAVRS